MSRNDPDQNDTILDEYGTVLREDGTVVIPNVKQCCYCGGSVDRFCWNMPDPHYIYSTKYFECRSCGATGDRNTGIMSKNTGDKVVPR